jgi:hypothetical protein
LSYLLTINSRKLININHMLRLDGIETHMVFF